MSRSKKGQSIVELVAGLIVIIPIVFFLIDIATLVIGITSGDSMCREAARAASAGNPTQAQTRAQRVIDQANRTKAGIIARYTLDSVTTPGLTIPAATTGGVCGGSVIVNTTVVVAPPFLLRAFAGQQAFTFASHQSFPITFTVEQTIQPN